MELEQQNPEGEPVNALEGVRDECRNGYEVAVAREAEEGRERLRAELEQFLKGEPLLAGVFRCLWEGVTKTEEVAKPLGVEEKKVVAAARKRLKRRIARFRERLGR